ncbi:sugar ABC transporter permease [Gordoniibacillus kamchatkensis]|uniref:Sugar ABC transporter permease n=1 Tax=Gordoniibacillus kamchatkensis TaxID=1590651 RepID=A0ABR5ABX3_9BACL|nr:sugar ABC transporter permease [Paenibacillus sp. VKM B-2647]KIL38536.1 sugar ABC transporter permease [Paenibacillus sp. VKM B-2647]
MRIRKETALAYTFLSPVLLFYAIFLVIPVLFSLFISFTDWGGFDLESMEWVGLKNYRKILSPESNFLHPVLTNTFLYAFGTVAISFCSALAVSFFISRLRFQGLWRTLYFLPSVTTIVAIGNVWLYMYNPTNGLINGIITGLGFRSVNFLDDPHHALLSVIVAGGWLGIGSSVLILSAGLKAIPDNYYEAASLEGAGAMRQYISITLPLLRPTILFVLITSFIGGLQSFTLTLVMTKNGGPGDSTNVGALEMYNQAFSFGNWGIASAMAFVLFVAILIITLVQLFIFRRGGVESY